MKKVKCSIQGAARRKAAKKGVPLVAAYHPSLKSLRKIIHDNFYLLYIMKDLNRTFYTKSYSLQILTNVNVTNTFPELLQEKPFEKTKSLVVLTNA